MLSLARRRNNTVRHIFTCFHTLSIHQQHLFAAVDSGAFSGTSYSHRPYIYHNTTSFPSTYAAAHNRSHDLELLDAEFDRVALACVEEDPQPSTSSHEGNDPACPPLARGDDTTAAVAEDIHESGFQGIPTFEGYTFRTSSIPSFIPPTDCSPSIGPHNPYLTTSHSNPLTTAKALLDSPSPSLLHTSLMLEAAIQLGDLGEGGYEAWVLLGEVRGMDESEEAGLMALREGVRIAGSAEAQDGKGLARRGLMVSCYPFTRSINIS